MSYNSTKLSVFGGRILCEDILYLSDDVGSPLNEVCNLVNGVGLALLVYGNKVNVAVSVNDEEADGIYGNTRSAAATEVLRTGLSVLLGIVVKAACRGIMVVP